jgi:carbamoylphosphate synthase small subunit
VTDFVAPEALPRKTPDKHLEEKRPRILPMFTVQHPPETSPGPYY